MLRAVRARIAEMSNHPDGDGWVPWTEDDAGRLHPPDLGELEEGDRFEDRYERDGTRLVRAWRRKTKAPDHDIADDFTWRPGEDG